MVTLHIVSCPERAAALASDALMLPASIDAAMCLRERGVTTLRLSDMVTPADFHEIWQHAMSAVWRDIESAASAPSERPQPLPIFGYHLAFALVQALVVGRWLDRAHARHTISRIEADHIPDHGGAEEIIALGISNAMYAEAAQAWAVANGIACELHRPGERGEVSNAPERRKWRATVRGWVKSVWHSRPVEYLRVRWALAGGASTIILMRNPGALPSADARPTRIAGVPLNWHAKGAPARSDDSAFQHFARSVHAPEVARAAGPFADLLLRRLDRRMQFAWQSGISVFRHVARLSRLVERRGGVPVLLADAPFNDSTGYPVGFAAEAMRLTGGRIIEYQHGGNYTVMARGFTPAILSAGLADLFLEWNGVGCREHEVYGLRPTKLKFAAVGAPAETLPARNVQPRLHTELLRLVYGPTVLSTVTLAGVNAPWDDYIAFLEEALALLNDSKLSVDVSVLPVPEMNLFLSASRHKYPRLRFHPQAFRRLAREADVLMADLLVSSPAYDAVQTDKPAIVWTGADLYQIDPVFLHDLDRRCVTYARLEAYLAGIGELARDPAGFLQRNARPVDPSFRLRYFPPVEGPRFWGAIDDLCQATAVEPISAPAAMRLSGAARD